MGWKMRHRAGYRFRMAHGLRPTFMFSLADLGLENFFLRRSAIWCSPPNRMFSSLALRRAMIVSATRICRFGRIIADDFVMEFQGAAGACSRLRTIHVGRSLILRAASVWLARRLY